MGDSIRFLITGPLLAAALLLAACEKPDPSFQTSPSARELTGVTSGNVAYNPPEAPPAPIAAPAGWRQQIELILFDKLENGTPSLRVLLTMKARPGAAMEVWLANTEGTVARWSGGSTGQYDGVVCFQMKLREKGESLQLPAGDYTATVAFRDVEKGIIAAQAFPVRGRVPGLNGAPPAEASPVFRDLLGCPRGS